MNASSNSSLEVATEYIGDTYDVPMKWYSGAICNDGSIYCAPMNASRVPNIGTSLYKTSLVGTDLGQGLHKYCGAVATNEGKLIYIIQANAIHVLKFSVETQDTSIIGDQFGLHGGWEKYRKYVRGRFSYLMESRDYSMDPPAI